jgi:small multidrug resistance pump
MGWIYLAAAIGFEIVATSALKASEGLTRLAPSLVVFPCYGVSFWCLAQALRSLQLGVTYAIWSAIGTAAIAIIGILRFGEPVTALKLASLGLVVIGVIGLNLSQQSG